MNQPHEPMRSISRELEAAERRRSSTIKLYIAAGALGLAGLVLVAGGLAIGNKPEPAEKKQSQTVIEEVVATEASVESVPAQPSNTVVESPTPAAVEPPPAAPVEPEKSVVSAPKPKPALQRVSINIGALGYEPATVEVRAGAPIELTVAKGEGCAAGFALPELGVSADNSTGPAKVRLDALEPGTYTFTCGMAMVEGRLVVS